MARLCHLRRKPRRNQGDEETLEPNTHGISLPDANLKVAHLLESREKDGVLPHFQHISFQVYNMGGFEIMGVMDKIFWLTKLNGRRV
jgi:hypothetical protein